jgi:hypothetical protein
MAENEYTFAFFPYLKTSEPVLYQSLAIKNSDDFTDLPPDVVRYLKTLCTMFFLRDHHRIQKISYAFHASSEGFSASEFTQQLLEFQALARFIYSSPHPTSGAPFLRYEHASLYLLQPKQVSKYLLVNDHNVETLAEGQNLDFDSRSEIEGYEGRLNNELYFWVTRGSRIFPPTVSLWLNISQDLSADLNYRLSQSRLYRPVLEYFTAREERDNLSERMLTALTWYNRSIEIDIDESVALVNLAIAFESLLDLEAGEKVTARFKEAVGLLVGDVPRLDSWLSQFYGARSQIVHKGRSASLMFVATDDPKKPSRRPELEYRSLVSYGRQVFQVCVATILTGAQIAKRLKLDSLLVTNQQRLERIFQALSKGDGTTTDRIVATSQDVRDIETYRFVAEKGLKVDQLISTAKLMIQQYLASDPDESSELTKRMQEFAVIDSDNHYEALSLLKVIQDSFKSGGIARPFSPIDLRSTVASMIDSVWHYTFMLYFHLEHLQKQKEAEESAQPVAAPDQANRAPN